MRIYVDRFKNNSVILGHRQRITSDRAHQTHVHQRDIGGPKKGHISGPIPIQCPVPESPDTQRGVTAQRYSSPLAATIDRGSGVCG